MTKVSECPTLNATNLQQHHRCICLNFQVLVKDFQPPAELALAPLESMIIFHNPAKRVGTGSGSYGINRTTLPQTSLAPPLYKHIYY